MSDAAPAVNGAATVPLAFLEGISAIAAQLPGGEKLLTMLDGVPGMARFAAEIDISQQIEQLALSIGRLLATKQNAKREMIFRREMDVVTVCEATGEVKPMTPGRLAGWASEFASWKGHGRNAKRPGLTREDAGLVMEQDAFRDALRPLAAVHTMRLPVIREGGEIEFLEPGYDSESGIFTCDLVPYDQEWELERGLDWLTETCEEMPWNGMEAVPAESRRTELRKNRSFAVHVGFCVGNFCRAMFGEGVFRPMSALFANKPGSGKTRLAEMQLAHVYGAIGATTAPKDEEKMDVKLETVGRALRPYVLFDDIGGSLRSQALNKFLTEARHQGRCYGSNSEFFDVPNVTQVIVTANELPTSADLSRRALVAELFLDVDVQGRTFKREITSGWLVSPEVRAKYLAASCAVLRHWMAQGRPRHARPLATFEEWTGLIGGMVQAAGLADMLATPEMDVGGASDEDEVKKLYVAVASMYERDEVIPSARMVEVARNLELLGDVIGNEGEDAPDRDQLKRFGRKLLKWRAQKLELPDGRRFTIGHKKKNTGANYPLTFLNTTP